MYQIHGSENNRLKNDSKIVHLSCNNHKNGHNNWKKQISGEALTKQYTIEEIKEIMVNIVSKRKYNVLKWNCHMAQENTRKSLGLKVNNEFIPIQLSGIHNFRRTMLY